MRRKPAFASADMLRCSFDAMLIWHWTQASTAGAGAASRSRISSWYARVRGRRPRASSSMDLALQLRRSKATSIGSGTTVSQGAEVARTRYHSIGTPHPFQILEQVTARGQGNCRILGDN